MPYKKIGDYGVIGDGTTLALIGCDGALDWMCLPFMGSPSVFAAILDDAKGGRFSISPDARYDSSQVYIPHTNVLQTRFRTAEGELELTDFMAAGSVAPSGPLLLRRAAVSRGRMGVSLECSPRFDYARRMPVREVADGCIAFSAADERLVLATTRPLKWDDDEHARVNLAAGDVLWLVMAYGDIRVPQTETDCEQLLESTLEYWREWVLQSETWRARSQSGWQERLDRAALVLKLLQAEKTGAIAAAGTTSLPAIVHGERNWDYRLSWIRDTSMTLSALFELGHVAETEQYLAWIEKVTSRGVRGRLSIVYRLHEPVPPDDETELDHLSGYKGSRPVRIGQYVIHQRQHDIYGELFDALFAVSRLVGKISFEHWKVLQPLVDEVIRVWREPDDGIWEARIGPRHYVHSKLMCWVALDRAIKIAQHYGFPGDLARWRQEREAVSENILEHGYNEKRGAFTQHYDTEAVDAALLLIPLTGFLPCADDRVAGTIKLIERELLNDRTLLRYKAEDGLEGQEQGFMICLFWYLHCLILQGRLDEVDGYLREFERYTNHLGLFGEQYEPRYQEITGNFPQAYSHIGYATTVLRYLEARRGRTEATSIGWKRKLALLFSGAVLNDGAEAAKRATERPAQAMKRAMNVVRGQFYDGHAQRVDYAAMRDSEAYQDFRELAAQLAGFDPKGFETDAERIAFWTNVFNALVIHGVVELGIRDSVKEVPLFFECICYRIGSDVYTATDIEHGILRGNAVPPYRLRRRLRGDDPRRRCVVEKVDPRIHFALVCASRTCPPIEAYDADCLDDQLDAAARTFINATSRLDGNVLHVSEIFRWYRKDFGTEPDAVARTVARHMYDREAAARIERNAQPIRLAYMPYDWRLNR